MLLACALTFDGLLIQAAYGSQAKQATAKKEA